MKVVFILTFASILIPRFTPAQTLDPAFDHMLESLLSHSVPAINCAALDTMRNPTLLDAREKREFNVSHLRGARWVGYNDFSLARVQDIDKSTPVIVYCSVGYRSEKISEELRRAGFQHVVNLYGGIFDWVNRTRPVFNDSGETNQIHAYDHRWGKWLTRGHKIYDE